MVPANKLKNDFIRYTKYDFKILIWKMTNFSSKSILSSFDLTQYEKAHFLNSSVGREFSLKLASDFNSIFFSPPFPILDLYT